MAARASGASGASGVPRDLNGTTLTVSGPTTLNGRTDLSGDVYLNRPVYFKDGKMMIDPKERKIYLDSIESDSTAVGSLFTQTATTVSTSTSLANSEQGEDRPRLAVATSTFKSVANASFIASTTTASTALKVNRSAKRFNRTTTATEAYDDVIIIGQRKYKAQQISVRTTRGKDVTLLAYVMIA